MSESATTQGMKLQFQFIPTKILLTAFKDYDAQIALEIANSNQGLLFEPIMTIIRRYQISDPQIPTFSLYIIELYPCSIKMILKTMRDTVRLW